MVEVGYYTVEGRRYISGFTSASAASDAINRAGLTIRSAYPGEVEIQERAITVPRFGPFSTIQWEKLDATAGNEQS